MMLNGRVFREGTGWCAWCEAIGAFTQGRTRKEAFANLAEVVEARVGQKSFRAKVREVDGDAVLVTGSNAAQLFGGLLRYQRERKNLSMRAAAARVGSISSTLYERMERGATSPRLATMQAAIAAIAPELALTVGFRLGTRRAEQVRGKRPERQKRAG